MNVGQLKELLEDYEDSLQVRLLTDHGQTPMSASGYGLGYIDEDTYMPEEVHKDDFTGSEITVFILEAF
jgi:hypothetical protein